MKSKSVEQTSPGPPNLLQRKGIKNLPTEKLEVEWCCWNGGLLASNQTQSGEEDCITSPEVASLKWTSRADVEISVAAFNSSRVKDVKARQVKFQELRGSEGDDNSTSIEENHKQKIIDEYGLDELNSDEDFEDFEETTTVYNNDDEEEEEEEVVEEDFNVDDYVPQASLYAPQLKVVNGQMILDQDSLEVDRRDQRERWTVNDTGLFYDAVRLFGSDFEMISHSRALLGEKPIQETPPEEELGTISEDPLEDQPPNQSQGEGQGQAKDEEEIEKLVIPSHLTNFDQYTRIVGIDCTGPISKSDGQGSGPIDLVDNDDDEEDDLVIEENLGG
ncbi:hypothetical protein H4Q26_004694 [Puccinia striiformis f. sp. tritici PST-130]|nr:hypothetical protein H4Q26_004694 [Puccinia striiformis f. sp. tritici PST-130]